MDAPIIDQYPLTLECKVDLAKLQPIVFDAPGMCYRALGEVVGGAWNAGKKFTE